MQTLWGIVWMVSLAAGLVGCVAPRASAPIHPHGDARGGIPGCRKCYAGGIVNPNAPL